MASRPLIAFYDLAVSPANFGVSVFAQLLELHCRRYDFGDLQVVIVPPEQTVDDGMTELSIQEREARIRNMLTPMFYLVPQCRGVAVLSSRESAAQLLGAAQPDAVFPRNYTLANPQIDWAWGGMHAAFLRGERFGQLSAPPEYLTWAGRYLEGLGGADKVVTLTVREESYGTEGRNAPSKEWKKLARYLQDDGYVPVIVRDTAKLYEPDGVFDDFEVCPMASQTIAFRAALYQTARANVFSAGGTHTAAMIVGAPLLQFNLASESFQWSSKSHFANMVGVAENGPFPMALKHQVHNWSEDTFDAMCAPLKTYLDEVDTYDHDAVWGYKDEDNRACGENLALVNISERLPFMQYVFPEDVQTLERIQQHGGVHAQRAADLTAELNRMLGR